MKYDCIVIGGGPAGLQASGDLERLGYNVILVEQSPTLGGHLAKWDRLYNDLKQQIDGLSLGTVYRNLKLLEELGLARRAVSIEGTERYDAICGDHIHFLCSGCGSIQDAANPDAQKIWQAANLAGNYLPQKMDLIFTGLCPECAKNQ